VKIKRDNAVARAARVPQHRPQTWGLRGREKRRERQIALKGVHVAGPITLVIHAMWLVRVVGVVCGSGHCGYCGDVWGGNEGVECS
jgi:hypothetical protein